MLLAAAQQTNQQMGGGPGANAMGEPTGPKPGPQAPAGQAMLGQGELADESLPGAGGGANAAAGVMALSLTGKTSARCSSIGTATRRRS